GEAALVRLEPLEDALADGRGLVRADRLHELVLVERERGERGLVARLERLEDRPHGLGRRRRRLGDRGLGRLLALRGERRLGLRLGRLGLGLFVGRLGLLRLLLGRLGLGLFLGRLGLLRLLLGRLGLGLFLGRLGLLG